MDLDVNLNGRIDQLKYIGPYLKRRFVRHSYWPPHTDRRYPIRTIQDLIDFVASRPQTRNVRRIVTSWLNRVTENARQRQCVPEPRRVMSEDRNYKVRRQNFMGFNEIVLFLRDVFPEGNPHRRKIPYLKRGRLLHNKYPSNCRLEN